jgi:Fe-S cluster biogenesis protein NfuA
MADPDFDAVCLVHGYAGNLEDIGIDTELAVKMRQQGGCFVCSVSQRMAFTYPCA